MKELPSQRLLETRRAAQEAQGAKGEFRDEILHTGRGGCDVESQVTARTFFLKKKWAHQKNLLCAFTCKCTNQCTPFRGG
jgi:hypothetical protein